MKAGKKRTIWRNQEGVTAVEFALVAPVMLLFTLGIIEISLMMLTQNILESATFMASRLGKTGYTASGMSREETILDEVRRVASSLLDMERVSIDSKSYGQFGDVGDPEPFIDANGNGRRDNGENFTDVNGNGTYDEDMGTLGAGESGEVVAYTVHYPWTITTPVMREIIGNNGIYNLSATTVVKNEPY